MRYALLAVLLATGSSAPAFAQTTGKLTGQVVDATTDQPLIGANVLLSGTLRGAATDDSGRFLLLGVPVGVYEVVISYVGYVPLTLEAVEVNAGYTRDVEIVALTPGMEMETVVVQYERPLLQKDAVGVPRVMSGADMANLPVRGVTEVLSIQPGVVAIEGRDEIYARGGRQREVAYFVDGVRVIVDQPDPPGTTGMGHIGIPQAAIQEQEMLIGNISARYGDVMSGVVNVTTKSGRPRFFGSLEALTSEQLDPYGTTLFSAALGGPVAGERLTFFVSGEFRAADDRAPRAVQQMRVGDAVIEQLERSPQVLPILLADGSRSWIELPGDMTSGAQLPVDDDGNLIIGVDGTIVASDTTVLQLPAGATPAPDFTNPEAAWPVLDPDLFRMDDRRRSAGLSGFSGTANLTFRPTSSIRVRVGGRGSFSVSEFIARTRALFAPASFSEVERLQGQGFVNWIQYLSPRSFYQLQADFGIQREWEHDARFSRSVEDLLYYGDIDHPVNAVAARFKKPEFIDGVPAFVTRSEDGAIGAGVYLAHQPGGVPRGYSKFDVRQLRFSGSATAQIGLHQVELGGEAELLTRRQWAFYGATHTLARWYDDSDTCIVGECRPESSVDLDGDGVPEVATSYETLPEQIFFDPESPVSYYGYDVRGLGPVDDEDILGFVDRTNYNLAPSRPRYYGGYVQDKVEFRDLVLNLGVRLDVFDNNTRVLRDPYARVPIVRAGSITDRPAGIGSDWAVYFDGDDVKGYRNLEGEFFNPAGEYVHRDEVFGTGTPRLLDLSGDDDEARRLAYEAVFEDYRPVVTVMPRIGVSFPVTDQSLFFGRYGVVSQRPLVSQFASLGQLLNRGATLLPNPDLKPEKTIEYEIGFRQRLGPTLALTLSGFFRQIKNLVTFRQVEEAYPYSYGTPQNQDFGTVKGFELDFDLRRTGPLALNANYTLSLAQGTGSEAVTVWGTRADPIRTIAPLDFDQRHRVNLSFDLRFGENEGPSLGTARVLEHVGLNVLVQAASGLPYTATVLEGRNDIGRNGMPRGGINAQRMPASFRLDLRVDRRIPLGDAASVSVFAWIQNVLDSRNVFGVYRSTGLPDENGFLLSPNGQAFLDAQPLPETAALLYAHQYRNPNHFGIPRMVRIGARVTF